MHLVGFIIRTDILIFKLHTQLLAHSSHIHHGLKKPAQEHSSTDSHRCSLTSTINVITDNTDTLTWHAGLFMQIKLY